MAIGKVIKHVRGIRELTQKEVAVSIGMDAGQYSRLENGAVDPSINTLRRVVKALEISLSELFVIEEKNNLKEVLSYNQSTMERVRLIDNLPSHEQHAIFTILDSFIERKKFKEAVLGEK